ncbi:MAG: rhodanese-like domain-containing protein [Candidatus Sumerlaeia bacterium]|nr:rhodanese-like domain-containing protein [Candidatus Sumerlaeia bacterium]
MRDLICTAKELKEMLGRGEAFTLLDVRTPKEHATARVEGSVLIPMDEVPRRLGEIEDLAERGPIVVLCHHGVRSGSVQAYLRQQGIANVRNLAGGIDRYSLEADPAVPRY